MNISRKQFEEIKNRYRSLLILDSDVHDALAFVYSLLEAEADAIKAKEPYATVSIGELEKALYTVYSLTFDIEKEDFCDDQ